MSNFTIRESSDGWFTVVKDGKPQSEHPTELEAAATIRLMRNDLGKMPREQMAMDI